MAVVGLGGAVATTAVAGLELLRLGAVGAEGLPLADVDADGLVPYESLVVGGWDLDDSDLAKAASVHGVLDHRQIEVAGPGLSQVKPWPAAGDEEFCRNVVGGNTVVAQGRRAQTEVIREDLRRFRETEALDGCVVVNLASTERWPDLTAAALQTPEAFEAGLDADDPSISPGMLYAYAAVMEGCGYANFTPSLAADAPALVLLAEQRGVPVAGKDGKTGQTMMKDGPGAGVPQPRAARRGLVLDEHPRQPRRPRARRPGVAGQQDRHQGVGARQHPGLPGRGPRRAHRLLPPAR
jgi:myo-inositol-1-phosphate synthase